MNRLTNDYLGKFVGGQLEVQNKIEGYLFRGEVETVSVEEGDLVVRLNWNARGEGFPPLPKKWVKDTDPTHLNYALSMDICAIADMSEKRLVLSAPIINETTVLFSRDGSRLDPSKVEGLVLE